MELEVLSVSPEFAHITTISTPSHLSIISYNLSNGSTKLKLEVLGVSSEFAAEPLDHCALLQKHPSLHANHLQRSNSTKY